MTEYEPRCKRWVQVSVVKASNIKNLDLRFGYTYFDIIANEQMVKFHIDYWNGVAIKVLSTARREGLHTDLQPHEVHQKQATTSVCVSLKAKPRMIVGQGESVFAQ